MIAFLFDFQTWEFWRNNQKKKGTEGFVNTASCVPKSRTMPVSGTPRKKERDERKRESKR
jgi:hypothetical protein